MSVKEQTINPRELERIERRADEYQREWPGLSREEAMDTARADFECGAKAALEQEHNHA